FTSFRRAGDPSTESLHAQGSSAKRFHAGSNGPTRGSGVAGLRNEAPVAPANNLLQTHDHMVMRAGPVPSDAASHASTANDVSGRVLSHGWAYLCADGTIFAWEQGMVASGGTGMESPGIRFEHPTMSAELAAVRALEAPVEAADLVVVSDVQVHDAGLG
ncbi:unnamed protein product, partial [Discosporangium mesarthrocarpum]